MRRIIAAFSVALFLAGCGFGDSDGPVGSIYAGGQSEGLLDAPRRLFSSPTGPLGLVAADEPRAALIGRDVMEAGGGAADAAAAMYFALAVTYPHAASLGGGGTCIYHAPGAAEAQTFEFFARDPVRQGAIAVPGNVRGFAILHARHGNLPWARIVSPAETLARAGYPISRALANSIARHADYLSGDVELRSLFITPTGAVKEEGSVVSQIELAATLSLIRSRGAGDFYTGQSAQALVSAAESAGGGLTMSDLRAFRPDVLGSRTRKIGSLTAHLPAEQTASRIVTAILEQLAAGDRYWNTPVGERASLVADVSGSLMKDVWDTQDEWGDRGSTGFVAVTRTGEAVACTVTMNRAFGTGDIGLATGVVFAMAPSVAGGPRGEHFSAPLLGINEFTGNLFFAAAPGGGPRSLANLAYTALASGFSESGNIAVAMANAPGDVVNLVNAVHCSLGLPASFESCQARTDPRGFGLADQAVPSG